MLGFILLQVRLVIYKFHHKEGLLYKACQIFINSKEKLNSIHPKIYENIENSQDESIMRNEAGIAGITLPTDYSMAFQRGFVILIGVMYLMFFFGRQSDGPISTTTLTQIIVTDLLFLFIIIEDQRIRKHVEKLVKDICMKFICK